MDLKRWMSLLALGCGLGVWTPVAHAETTGGETDTDSADDGRDDCGGTCDAQEGVTIAGLADGAEVAPALTVTVEAADGCSCDTCGCYDTAPLSISLHVDGEMEASCRGCTSPHDFEIELSPGAHELRAYAEYDFDSASSDLITVTVTGDDPTTGGPATGGATTGDQTGGASGTDPTGAPSTGSETPQDDEGGGGCSVGGSSDAPLALGGFAILLLATRRRRSSLAR